MSFKKQLESLTDKEITDICSNFTSATKYVESKGMSKNGRYLKVLNDRRKKLGLEWKNRSGKITKDCPVCGAQFTSRKYDNQTTCSYACSNTYFRSGEDNGMYKGGNNYRTICFNHHKKQCVVCGESQIVAVHHYDENHDNNDPANLVPLCPTHHQYAHSRFKHEVQHIIDEYVTNFRS